MPQEASEKVPKSSVHRVENIRDAPATVHCFTPQEVADFFRIHINTVYKWARISPKKGGPPRFRLLRNRIRFPRVEFIEWLERRN